MNSKHCPYCYCSTQIVKIGKTSAGRQRYKCRECRKTWTNKPRISRLEDIIWHEFAYENICVKNLARRHKLHPNTIRKIIRSYKNKPLPLLLMTQEEKDEIKVIMLDTTYFGRRNAVVIGIDANRGTLLYFQPINHAETNADYVRAINFILSNGVDIKACVIDGRKGVKDELEAKGILVQNCLFHIKMTVKRHLASDPLLQSNIELKNITDTLCNEYSKVDELHFYGMLMGWRNRHLHWLNERHRTLDGSLVYSHQETRKAFNVLSKNFKTLFTYEHYPELNIPRTSNRIEGAFGNAKDKMRIHHGYSYELKIKILFSLLSGE